MPRKTKAQKAALAALEADNKPSPIEATAEATGQLHAYIAGAPIPEAALAELPPPPTEIVPHPEAEPIRHAEKVSNGRHRDAETHVAQLDRPSYSDVPARFMIVVQHNTQGMRVHKSRDYSTVAIQFAENRLPTIAEKQLLEALDVSDGELRDRVKFTYQPASRMWERRVADGEPFGANIIDGTRIAAQIADGRGRSR